MDKCKTEEKKEQIEPNIFVDANSMQECSCSNYSAIICPKCVKEYEDYALLHPEKYTTIGSSLVNFHPAQQYGMAGVNEHTFSPMIQLGASITSIGRENIGYVSQVVWPFRGPSIDWPDQTKKSTKNSKLFCQYCMNVKIDVQMQYCCEKIFYCSKNCQKKDWNRHSKICTKKKK